MSTPSINLIESYVQEAGYYAMRDRLEREDDATLAALLAYTKDEGVAEACRDLIELRKART